jgi:hypothetical protein
MTTNDDPSANDNPTTSGDEASGNQTGSQPKVSADKITDNTGNTAVGSGINQNYANRDQFSGIGTINIYNDRDGNPSPPNTGTPQHSSGSQSVTPSLNTFILNQNLKDELDDTSMRQICDYINVMATYKVGLGYDDLQGTGPRSKTLSLITFCQQRRALTLLIDGVNAVRPELLSGNYNQWHAWAMAQDARLQGFANRSSAHEHNRAERTNEA